MAEPICDYISGARNPTTVDKARKGKRVAYYMDAAHMIFKPFPGFLWSVARRIIPALSGRQRFNVPGALNAITNEMVTIPNDTDITA